MAKKFDDELLDDARKENKKFHQNGSGGGSDVKTDTQNSGTDDQSQGNAGEDKKTDPKNTGSESSHSNPPPPPPKDEFQEKFDEYFKGMENIIAGRAITEIADDFKTKMLYVYAKKHKVDIPMDVLRMDEKSKMFCAFLIDHAIKNKMLDWIKKYPLIAAAGVVAVSGASSFLLIQMMKQKDDDNENLRKENEDLKKKAASNTDVKDIIAILDKK